MAEGPGEPVAVARAQGVAVVLDEPQVVLLDQLHDRVEVERHAERVRQHDRARARRDGRPQLVRVGVVVAQADVDEHRHQAVLHDRRHGAREARRDGDHLVAGLEAPLAELGRGERREGHQVRRRAGVDEQGVREAEVVGDARLELLGEAARGEVEVEARVDQVAQLLLAEHAAGVAHRVAVGVERRRRVALAVVPAHQLEDLARECRPPRGACPSSDRPPSSAPAQGSPAARASSW